MEKDDAVERWYLDRDAKLVGDKRKDFTFNALEEVIANGIWHDCCLEKQDKYQFISSSWLDDNIHKFQGWR